MALKGKQTKSKTKAKKQPRVVERGRIYVRATFNNTLVTVTDEAGKPLVVGSCGMHGFVGTRKSTPYAATVTVQSTLEKAMNEFGLRTLGVYIKGVGPGRSASLKAIRSMDIDVTKILDLTPIPHNGVRPPKMRRG